MGAIIAVINKKGENAARTAVVMLKSLAQKNVEKFGVASSNNLVIKSSIDKLENETINSSIIIGYAFSKILPQDKPQPLKLKTATMVFEGRLYEPMPNGFDAEFVAKKLQKNPSGNAAKIIKEFEGDFAFIIAEDKRIVAGRDPLGIRPLYYGQNSNFAALASQRKALWSIGIEKSYSFPPGHVAIVRDNGFHFRHVKTITYSQPRKVTMQSATPEIQKLLQKSIKQRLSGLKEVALAFSGGLDSSIIAFLAKKIVPNVQLIHVSLSDQPEIEDAKKGAEALGLPLQVFLYDEDDVEMILPKILWLIEETSPIQASIAIPVFWTAEKTETMGFKVLLAGQGADELFGGYKKYVTSYQKHGREKVHKTIFNDVVKMHEINFERDFKICSFHSVELRLPFATYEMAKFAAQLPPELKIELTHEGLRKVVLRNVAKNLGLPSFIIEKPKRAVQYATGVSKALEKIARRKGLSLKEFLHNMSKTVLEETTYHE